jgi:hypothetical protein
MATKGRGARIKGHAFERKIAEWWRARGFENCKTSRFESKMLDDKKVDLTHTGPFYCQCKAVENLGSIHNVLAEMPKEEKYNLVFHQRARKGIVVAMMLEDFEEILDMLTQNKII